MLCTSGKYFPQIVIPSNSAYCLFNLQKFYILMSSKQSLGISLVLYAPKSFVEEQVPQLRSRSEEFRLEGTGRWQP